MIAPGFGAGGADGAVRVCVVGVTGLIGMALVREGSALTAVRMLGVTRREVALPAGSRAELVLSDPAAWDAALAVLRPDVVVCALGTTRAKAGSEAAFRAVDVDLVGEVVRAAKAAGAGRFVLVSSVGADAASANAYLRAKGDAEALAAKAGFRRLDVVRPGLLRGRRGERRLLEGVAQALAPLMDLALQGNLRRYRSIRDGVLARAILALALEKAGGRFVHEHDALLRAAARLDGGRG